MQALKRAADRGVKVRIYLDGTQFAEREPTRVFEELAQCPRRRNQDQARKLGFHAPQEL
jgi:phosphatidylserine/phosphatidylglycerophosphate/cardiolipin synthase-like enzyme